MMMQPIPRLLRADYSGVWKANPFVFGNASVADYKGHIQFKFSNCLDFSSWTTLFDQYRINKVVVEFIPVQTQAMVKQFDDTTTVGAGVNLIPRFTSCIDLDDSVNPTDFNVVFQRPNSRTVPATEKVTYTFTPTRLGMVYRSSSQTGYVIDSDTRKFVDCAQNDVPHYGIKYVITPTSPANAFQYRIETKYYISLKNRRY
jgi:hypothetical protein